MYRLKYCILLVFLSYGLTNLCAQESETEICISFPVGSQIIDPNYSNNAENIDKMVSFLNRIENDSNVGIVKVSFSGATSLEGSYQRNNELASGRLSALENFVRSRFDLPDNVITREDEYIPWDFLIDQVRASDISDKDEIISIINEKPELVSYGNGRNVEDRVVKLKTLNNGKAWNEIQKRFFVQMRNACAVFVTYQELPVQPAVEKEITETPIVEEYPDTVSTSQPMNVTPEIVKEPFYMALKTNLLYDVLLVPNVGIEFYLGKQWSISANWMYSWWHTDTKHRYWRTYGGDIAIRKWFGSKAENKPLTGHHFGVYGQMLTYDFETGGKGYLGDRWSYAGGVEYGYSLPLSRRLNMDFTIGVGYLGGEYKEYKPIEGHYVWQATKNRHWFGPTKAEVSLIWLIGRGNHNERKGGMR